MRFYRLGKNRVPALIFSLIKFPYYTPTYFPYQICIKTHHFYFNLRIRRIGIGRIAVKMGFRQTLLIYYITRRSFISMHFPIEKQNETHKERRSSSPLDPHLCSPAILPSIGCQLYHQHALPHPITILDVFSTKYFYPPPIPHHVALFRSSSPASSWCDFELAGCSRCGDLGGGFKRVGRLRGWK